MAIVMLESFDSPSGMVGSFDNTRITVLFKLRGSDVAADIYAYLVANVPVAYTTIPDITLYRQDYNLSSLGGGYWTAAVTYAVPKYEQRTKTDPTAPTDPTDPGNPIMNFSTMASTVHVQKSLRTVSSQVPTGGRLLDFGGFVGVQSTDQIDGVDVYVPEFMLEFDNFIPASAVTMTFIKNLQFATGCVNLDTWKTFNAGEVLYLGTSGGLRADGMYAVKSKFKINLNVADIRSEYADLTAQGYTAAIPKEGHQYAWFRYENGVVGAGLTKRATQCNIENVYFGVVFATYLARLG
jgi:hypothetical protein